MKNYLFFLSFLSLYNLSAQGYNDNCVGREIPDELINFISVISDPNYQPELCINYPIGPATLELVFNDEFSGNTLDYSKWIDVYQNHSYLVGGTSQTVGMGYTVSPIENSDNYVFPGNDRIVLKALDVNDFYALKIDYLTANYISQDDLGDNLPNFRRFSYTNGELRSLRNFKHGYFEIRCKIPSVEGVWPSFWLWRNEGNERVEIDIFEINQIEGPHQYCVPALTASAAGSRLVQTYHDWQQYRCSSTDVNLGVDLSLGFHTYGLYWDEYQIIWFFDGLPIRSVFHYSYQKKNIFGNVVEFGPILRCSDFSTYSASNGYELRENVYFPNESCRIMIGNDVINYGNSYTIDPSTDGTCTTFSGVSEYEIEYVRVYGLRNCSTSDIAYCDDPGNIPSHLVATNNITLGGNCPAVVRNPRQDAMAWGDFSSTQQVEAIAGNEIKLKPGFKVEPGAKFHAAIDDCATVDLRASVSDNTYAVNEMIQSAILEGQQKYTFKDSSYIEDNVTISPNPFTHQFIIQSSLEQFDRIDVLDFTGRLIATFSKTNFPYEINLSELSDGIYFIRVLSEEKTITKKIIKSSN